MVELGRKEKEVGEFSRDRPLRYFDISVALLNPPYPSMLVDYLR